ncbi:hypothetical protein [Streptomyces chartreusis]|uniref:hypothetical protein n=1 Tax=Streptomyces chartreusis TaxID=1969 RepID=UPI0036D171E3
MEDDELAPTPVASADPYAAESEPEHTKQDREDSYLGSIMQTFDWSGTPAEEADRELLVQAGWRACRVLVEQDGTTADDAAQAILEDVTRIRDLASGPDEEPTGADAYNAREVTDTASQRLCRDDMWPLIPAK